jgi:hypothetical protein
MKKLDDFNQKIQDLTKELSQWVRLFINENPDSGHLLPDLNLILVDLATQSFKQMQLRKPIWHQPHPEELKDVFLRELIDEYIQIRDNSDIIKYVKSRRDS